MKEVFYPRDIGMWRNTFDFGIEIGSQKPKFMVFDKRSELIDFLKKNGVRLNDANHPLKFIETKHDVFGPCLTVCQWSIIGWIVNQ